MTEEDYIHFIRRMTSSHSQPIHKHIVVRLSIWPTLNIGCSLKDYNLRLLFRILRWHIDVAEFPLSFSVDPSPDNLIVSVWRHEGKPMVSFIREDLWDVVPTLYKECMGREYHKE